MSSVKIEFSIDNAAFEDMPQFGISDLLINLARDIRINGTLETMTKPLMDFNGNVIGSCVIDIDEVDEEDENQNKVKDFVKKMSRAEVRTTLEEACGIQTYDHESDDILGYALVLSILSDDTTIENIVDRFPHLAN